MSIVRTTGMLLLLFAMSTWCAKPVVFLGLANEGAPAIEKSFTRLIEEHFATLSEVSFINNEESKRLQARMDQYTYPVMTSSLAASLKRFSHDSAFIVWAMVRECTVQPVRHFFFKAKLHGTLIIELTIFHFGKRTFAYTGEAHASLTQDKGLIFWFGPVEDAVQVTAQERAQLIEKLQVKAAISAGDVLNALLLHERSKKQMDAPPPQGIKAHEISVEPSSGQEQLPEEEEEKKTDLPETGEALESETPSAEEGGTTK
ncbi:MAG: hypothetical protein JW768_02390 [Chitinispirillaceae bacterium]|nr:hypothetical protein [Chitinispirillaceae bacterium]